MIVTEVANELREILFEPKDLEEIFDFDDENITIRNTDSILSFRSKLIYSEKHGLFLQKEDKVQFTIDLVKAYVYKLREIDPDTEIVLHRVNFIKLYDTTNSNDTTPDMLLILHGFFSDATQ